MYIFPLVSFTGVIIHDTGGWWAVGNGTVRLPSVNEPCRDGLRAGSSHAGGCRGQTRCRSVGIAKIYPDPTIDPCEHWGRVFRSIADPWSDPLFKLLSDTHTPSFDFFYGSHGTIISTLEYRVMKAIGVTINLRQDTRLRLVSGFGQHEDAHGVRLDGRHWTPLQGSQRVEHLAENGWGPLLR